MDILELDARCRDFRHRFCGTNIDDEVPLSFVAEVFFLLGVHPSDVMLFTKRTREMVAGDIGLENTDGK